MKNGNENGNYFGKTFTFAVVLRGQLEDINNLINFLNTSGLTVAHQEIGQEKMYIKKERNHEYTH